MGIALMNRLEKLRSCGQTMRFAGTAIAVFVMLLLWVGAALAEPCHIIGLPYHLVGDTVHWSMQIKSGHSCLRGLRFGNVSIESVELVSKPRSGQIALLGWGFSYSSGAAVGEEDSFTVAVVGKINKEAGSSTIQITVSVIGQKQAPGPAPIED
jgi:hypothetical protein